MPASSVRTLSWRARAPAGSMASIRGRHAAGVDDLLERRERDHRRRAAPSSLTASASPVGSSPATRSPQLPGAADPALRA